MIWSFSALLSWLRTWVPTKWRIWLATLLLLVGVASLLGAGDPHLTYGWSLLYGVGGGLCLFFVPALTADYVLHELKRRRWW